MSRSADFGYCRLCEKQLDGDVPQCPHCGQVDPLDRFVDLEPGSTYEAEHLAPVVEGLHWFRLTHSGRRVFARVAQEQGTAFRAACESGNSHRLECSGFESRYPAFRYLP